MENTFTPNTREWALAEWIKILNEENETAGMWNGLAAKIPYGDEQALVELSPNLVKSKKWLFKDDSHYTIDLLFEGKKILSYVQKRNQGNNLTFELEKIIRFERGMGDIWGAMREAVEGKKKKHFLWGNVVAHTGTSW